MTERNESKLLLVLSLAQVLDNQLASIADVVQIADDVHAALLHTLNRLANGDVGARLFTDLANRASRSADNATHSTVGEHRGQHRVLAHTQSMDNA